MSVAPSAARPPAPDADIVIVGAGFAGLYMALKCLQLGLRTMVLEAGSGVGGTWYWNRYPGARCDVESMQYSYSFSSALQDEWRWSERYAAQPEILRYAQHVAERFDLLRHITFDTRVDALTVDEPAATWQIRTACGRDIRARFVVLATGALSAPKRPTYPGLEHFSGRILYTSEWPHEAVDLAGERVAVVGTGSSGIQVIPRVAEVAGHLTVFQRTPNYSIPARNRVMTEAEERSWKGRYGALREAARATPNAILMDRNPARALSQSPAERERTYETYWSLGGLEFMAAFADLRESRAANDTAAEFVREKIRRIVRDPRTAAMLTPTAYPIGSKRVCVDAGYFETFNRANVALVDLVATPIERAVPEGLVTAEGLHPVDSIIFATGFDAFTGAPLRMEISGRAGVRLADAWAGGARTYLGLMVANFPNLFMITGPGSPSVLGNVIMAIEQHVEFVAALLSKVRDEAIATVDATAEAQDLWAAHCDDVASRTMFPGTASWWMGANIDGKPRAVLPYAGGFEAYGQILADVAGNAYRGLTFAAVPASVGPAAG